MKSAFLAIRFLAYYNLIRLTIMELNMSDKVLERCLSQLDLTTGVLCPITIYSQKLIPTEFNYGIYNKEILAIVECLKL